LEVTIVGYQGGDEAKEASGRTGFAGRKAKQQPGRQGMQLLTGLFSL